MDKLNFGDVVLLKFPFTDGKTYKRRPALIISDFDDGDVEIIMGRIDNPTKEKVHTIISKLTD